LTGDVSASTARKAAVHILAVMRTHAASSSD
jgi:hypothetical protein